MTPRTRAEFERQVLTHLDAAHNVAVWLLRDRDDAADVVQEACMRAWRHWGTKGEGTARAWLLAIVRNSAMTWMGRNRRLVTPGDEGLHRLLDARPPEELPEDPERQLQRTEERATLTALVDALPKDQREIILLREVEDLSYREIAEITGLPIGTVMSRLARARERLRDGFFHETSREGQDGLRR